MMITRVTLPEIRPHGPSVGVHLDTGQVGSIVVHGIDHREALELLNSLLRGLVALNEIAKWNFEGDPVAEARRLAFLALGGELEPTPPAPPAIAPVENPQDNAGSDVILKVDFANQG